MIYEGHILSFIFGSLCVCLFFIRDALLILPLIASLIGIFINYKNSIGEQTK